MTPTNWMTGAEDESHDGGDLSPAALFAIVWTTLAGVLGTAAVAAIVRRANKRGAVECPELLELVVLREDLAYRYHLPQNWSETSDRGLVALRVLVLEIGRLLVELTGTVLIVRLEEIPALRARGLVWRAAEMN